MGFQADRHDGIAVGAVVGQIGVCPRAEDWVIGIGGFEACEGFFLEIRRCEIRFDGGKHLLVDARELGADEGKAFFDPSADVIDPMFVHGDFDACLVFVVASPEQVVDGDDRLKIGQQVFLREKVLKHFPDHRGAAQDRHPR